MNNTEYYELIRKEWEQVLGKVPPIVAEEERAELHRLIQEGIENETER